MSKLIDASAICHKLRKPLGNKKNEFLPEDRAAITKLYSDFVESDVVKIFDNTEFMYREYAVMQPLQRSYAINAERIEQLLAAGGIDGFYDYNKVYNWENSETALSDKDKKKLDQYKKNEDDYNNMLDVLHKNMSNTIWYKKSDFENFIKPQLSFLDNKTIEKLIDILSKIAEPILFNISKQFSPLILIIPIPPTPGAVDIATIVDIISLPMFKITQKVFVILLGLPN